MIPMISTFENLDKEKNSNVNNHIFWSSVMQIFLIPASFEWEGWEKYFPPSLSFVNFETENWGQNFFSEGAIWSTLSKLLHKSFCHFTIFSLFYRQPIFKSSSFVYVLLVDLANLQSFAFEQGKATAHMHVNKYSQKLTFLWQKSHTHASQFHQKLTFLFLTKMQHSWHNPYNAKTFPAQFCLRLIFQLLLWWHHSRIYLSMKTHFEISSKSKHWQFYRFR